MHSISLSVLSLYMTRTRACGITCVYERPPMNTDDWHETFVEQTLTYALEVDGKFYLIENVPARN